MAYHHLALATRDVQATHTFYTRAMGFELVKTVVAPTPEGGWARHFFYETGGDELLAFWDLREAGIDADFPTAISSGLGLPEWVNHVAFAAADRSELATRRTRLVDAGYHVLEVDHGWCESIYTRDPNGILVEFCTTTRSLGAADREHAQRALFEAEPELEATPPTRLYRASRPPLHEVESD